LFHLFALPVISLDILKATKVITFNAAADLNLGPATLVVASSAAELAPVETKFDTSTQRASLTFAEELPAGSKAILRVGFEAILTDSMTGYYKSTWERGTYALTQFEVRGSAVHMYTRWPSLLGPNVELASDPKRLTVGTHIVSFQYQ
jgi:aminopeptidase 2